VAVRKAEVIERQSVFGFLFDKTMMKFYTGIVSLKLHGCVRSEITGPLLYVFR
jgi:hypothetical protein